MGCAQEENFPGCLICFRVFINIFTITGFIMSLLVADSCQFFDYVVNDESSFPNFGGGPLEPEGSIGMFRFRSYQENCMDYPQSFFDEAMKTARVGAVIGVSGGGLALICTLSEALICAMGMMCTIPTSFFLVVGFFGQCLAYAIFATENLCDYSNCKFGQGAAYNTAAFVLYFFALFMVCTGPTGDSVFGSLKKRKKARKAEAARSEESQKRSTSSKQDEEEAQENQDDNYKEPPQDPQQANT